MKWFPWLSEDDPEPEDRARQFMSVKLNSQLAVVADGLQEVTDRLERRVAEIKENQ